jgi:hypothetical protein
LPESWIQRENWGIRDAHVKNAFQTALEAAEIKDFTWHDLRHTFASWLIMKGASLRSVAELLGHRGLRMVMRYAHLSPCPSPQSHHLREIQGVGCRNRPEQTVRATTGTMLDRLALLLRWLRALVVYEVI